MKTLNASMLTHLAGEVITLSTFWKVTLQDATVLGFTDYDQPITISSVLYNPAPAYSTSEIQSSTQLNVDNLSVNGYMDGVIIIADQMRAGRWDYATVEIFRANPNDLTMGTIPLRKGKLGEVHQGNIGFEVELRGLTQFLQQTIGRLYLPTCDANLYDSRCGVRAFPGVWAATTAYTANSAGDAITGSLVRPTTANNCYFLCTVAGTSGGTEPAWTTTIGGTTIDGTVTWKTLQSYQLVGAAVTTVTSQRQFTASGITHPATWFAGGTVTWTTGLNTNYSAEVKTHNAGGVIILQTQMPYAIANGDQFTIKAGCDLLYATCKSTKFDNAYNFQGFPYLPGVDRLMTGT